MSMERQWEEFENGRVVSLSERIHVTINKRGSIYLNRRALEAIGEPERVVLLFDRRRSTIGVRPAPDDQLNAYRLGRKDKKSAGSRVIYATNFFKQYHIKPDGTFAFTSTEVDQNGILVLELSRLIPTRRKS